MRVGILVALVVLLSAPALAPSAAAQEFDCEFGPLPLDATPEGKEAKRVHGLLSSNPEVVERAKWICGGEELHALIVFGAETTAPASKVVEELQDVWNYDVWNKIVVPNFPVESATVLAIAEMHEYLVLLEEEAFLLEAFARNEEAGYAFMEAPDGETLQALENAFRQSLRDYRNFVAGANHLEETLLSALDPVRDFRDGLPDLEQQIKDEWWCVSGCEDKVEELAEWVSEILRSWLQKFEDFIESIIDVVRAPLEQDIATMDRALNPPSEDAPGLGIMFTLLAVAGASVMLRRRA